MFKLNKEVIDLSETQQIWIHPGDSIRMELNFERDVSDCEFKFSYKERDWSFSPYTYSLIGPSSTSDWVSLSENNKVLIIEIPENETINWTDKTIEFQIYSVEEDGFQWVPVDGTITVAGGV